MANNLDDLRQRGIPYGEAVARMKGSGVSAPGALTSAASQPGAYSQTENQKLRDDIAALRTTLNALVTFINSGG